MRTVVRNSFARHTIKSERVRVDMHTTCTECGSVRTSQRVPDRPAVLWLLRFHVDDDQGSRSSGPIAGGKLFCSRSCAEGYTGRSFDETRGAR